MTSPRIVQVATAAPYDVTVGENLLQDVANAVPESAMRVLVVTAAPLRRHVDNLKALLDSRGLTVVIAEVPDAEEGKSAEVLAFCWGVLGKSDFTRSDVVIGFGGGAVTDLAGFVAATWLRGVGVIQVPTTLLAMVDAAVGGKTGINTAEGKNLVGAFHEPLSVWCDVRALDTLPQHDLVAGLAEVVKCGFIRDPEILTIVEENLTMLRGEGREGSLDDATRAVLVELITRAIQVKADVVSADLKESYLREILNYGHTFAHAIEYTERYQWRHGAAVSVGMVFVAELAHLAGKLTESEVDRHRTILAGLGLPTTYPGHRWDALLTAMRRDKKTRGDLLRFVILNGLQNPVRLEGPDPAILQGAYAAVSA
ncbi:3-dehydroquinate synthase [Demequina lignilytica]|uniref:3-dehydroquinate synthase n=1 Tax=Demequina lignilytica TaxID=3051663 RepID=A0AB35ME66_9MICO|nr:3-dehydroquinate synthase [Demequina sp. SYSU T0a273]MDN4482044.1 3-dehydroquinate synthase [Demequina sp. SYSU T0a273]